MTKADLVNKVKMLEQINSELDSSLDEALSEIKYLKSQNKFLKKVISKDEETLTMEDLRNMQITEDGELSKEGLVMLIKAGMTQKDIQELVDKGDEIVEWLEKKGIKLDSGGNLDKN